MLSEKSAADLTAKEDIQMNFVKPSTIVQTFIAESDTNLAAQSHVDLVRIATRLTTDNTALNFCTQILQLKNAISMRNVQL